MKTIPHALSKVLFYAASPFAFIWYRLRSRFSRIEKDREFAHGACAVIRYGWSRRQPRYGSVAELVRNGAHLLERSHASVHDVIVVDNFYEDPDTVRRQALQMPYVRYAPNWYSSALEISDNPLKGKGSRILTSDIKKKLSAIIRTEIDNATWATSGDGWNGAFHYRTGSWVPGGSSVHNHVGRDEDVRPGGWSGLVYLSPHSRKEHGTSIWMEKKTGKCYSIESIYSTDLDRFEMILSIDNVYNRLVLFYASVLHVAAPGHGDSVDNARLFQTFFFNVQDHAVRTWKGMSGANASPAGRSHQ